MNNDRRERRLRCFVAIRFDLLPEMRDIMAELGEVARDPQTRLRIQPPENLHVTLKFLGPVAETALAGLAATCTQVAARHRELELHCRGLGFFKNSIWLGIDPDAGLAALAAEIDQALVLQGFNPELKSYVPHVTIARFAPGARIMLSEMMNKYGDRAWGAQKISQISLYRSDTLPEGARYTILESYKLSAA